MFVRIGIVVVAVVLLAAVLGGLGFCFDYLRFTDHGVEFGYKEPPREVAVAGPGGVSVDDLLKRKGIEYVDPDQAPPPATNPSVAKTVVAPAPVVGQQSDHVAGTDGTRKNGIIRVAAGSNQPLTDPDGNVWEAANGFDGGEIADRGEFKVKNSKFPGLYRYERWNVNSWRCKLPNGSYKVTLHFAEGFDGVRGAKQRFFGVEVQGEPIDPIDIFRESGGLHREVLRSAPALVNNGTLTINFLPSRSRFPNLINGIEVIPDTPVAVRWPAREEGNRKFADLRIAAGSTAALRDPSAQTWFADSGFEGGQVADRGPIYVRGTEFPDVYRHERYGMTAWHAEVPDGNYIVRLHFAETSPSVSRAGQRVCNIIVKDQPLRDFDVFKESGGKNMALVKTFHVSVTEGKLTILFQPVAKDKNVPEINGIEVIRER